MTTAWLFAGHGAQYVGMGRAILRETEAGRTWLAEAERASGLALARLADFGPSRALSDPRVLEPLLAAVSGAHADLMLAEEGPPDAVAAYSAGHVAALYAARVIDRAACLRIACIRGAELADAAARFEGGMVAVHGLPEDELAYLAEADPTDPASLAARNAPTHVVYSGCASALSLAAARATAAGAVTSPLDVAGPWHSPLLQAGRVAIEAALAAIPFMPACLPVWSSVTALATRDPARLRWSLGASVSCTVEWHATVQAMLRSGVTAFVEVSPGRSLWGLLGQIDPPHEFTRRYVECQRGPARRRAPSIVGRHHRATPQNQQTSVEHPDRGSYEFQRRS